MSPKKKNPSPFFHTNPAIGSRLLCCVVLSLLGLSPGHKGRVLPGLARPQPQGFLGGIPLYPSSDFHVLSHCCVIVGVCQECSHRNRDASHWDLTYIGNNSAYWYWRTLSLTLEQVWWVQDLLNGDETMFCGPGGLRHVNLWLNSSSMSLMSFLFVHGKQSHGTNVVRCSVALSETKGTIWVMKA